MANLSTKIIVASILSCGAVVISCLLVLPRVYQSSQLLDIDITKDMRDFNMKAARIWTDILSLTVNSDHLITKRDYGSGGYVRKGTRGGRRDMCSCDQSRGNSCPAGIPGAPGASGAIGQHGPPGKSGMPGMNGESGIDSDSLVKCPVCVSPEGPPGSPGPVGEPGPKGPPGWPADPPRPPAGMQGEMGKPGKLGPVGKRGPNGKMGMSVMTGKGPQGPKGKTGKAGIPGNDGRPGVDRNRPGSPGRPGPRGKPGMRGPIGRRGQIGVPGTPGTPGNDAGYCACPRRNTDYNSVQNVQKRDESNVDVTAVNYEYEEEPFMEGPELNYGYDEGTLLQPPQIGGDRIFVPNPPLFRNVPNFAAMNDEATLSFPSPAMVLSDGSLRRREADAWMATRGSLESQLQPDAANPLLPLGDMLDGNAPSGLPEYLSSDEAASLLKAAYPKDVGQLSSIISELGDSVPLGRAQMNDLMDNLNPGFRPLPPSPGALGDKSATGGKTDEELQ